MSEIQRLLDIMARLRDPDSGCPWDLEQDFESISPFTIEEAYEVDEAIASGDPEALRDELGDLLFQVVFQARIAEEKGLFSFDGVIEAIASKLVRRHPHVFADAAVPGTAEAQTATWEDIKAAERAAAGRDESGESDPFDGIPRHLPALARSAKVSGRIERLPGEKQAALDPGEADLPIRDRVLRAEESARAVAAASRHGKVARAEALALVGDGIRSWVRLARSLGVDPEQALREADDALIAAVRER